MTITELKELIKECILETTNAYELEKLGFKPVKESGGYEDKITNALDRQKYVALRKMEKAHLLKSKMTKDTKQQHHLDMANDYLNKALDIARKYGAVNEANVDKSTLYTLLEKLGFKPAKGDVNENDTEGLSEMKLVSETKVSKELEYHLVKKLSLSENVFRTYSDAYFALINEVRGLYLQNKIELCDPDAELVESDIGKKAIYEGREVYLDAPIESEEDLMMEVKHRGKNVRLNRPFRTPGGPKKYTVYVKSKSGNIKKVTFGDPGLRVRGSSAARRKSFAARHKCSQKKDRTTAGYWSCRSHRIKSLGNKGKGRYW
jgi:hypothetical protein